MFVNNIPLQIQIDSNTNFEKLLELVKENVLFAMQNQLNSHEIYKNEIELPIYTVFSPS